MPPKTVADAVTPLQRIRLELGWKQSRLIAELTAYARRHHVTIAEPASLKTQLSRWENGHGQPDAVYRRLFCVIYQRDEEELGFTASRRAADAPRVAPTLDTETVDYFQTVFDQHVRADGLMGPHHLVDVVRAQATLLDNILPDARGPIRADLLLLACQYNELTGWLYQDAGDPTNAMLYSDRAMDYALAMDDPMHTAYLMMRKSNIACDLGSPDRALGLAAAGLREPSKVPPRIRSLVLGQQARAHALRGDSDACSRSIEAAMREVVRPSTDPIYIARYATPEYIRMQSATCWAELNVPDRAIPVFEKALSTWPESQRRDRGLCLTRLASAHAARGDREHAYENGIQAVRTVRTATSARALRDLRQLRERLVPWRRNEEVLALSHEIKSLIQGI
jgi:tetratricopeptide (TPR) repeat protein